MATVTNTHDAAGQLNTTGRALQLVSMSKTNITQAEMNAVVTYVELTGSIVGISAFIDGATDVVYMLVEGPTVAAGASFGGVTGVTSAAVADFV